MKQPMPRLPRPTSSRASVILAALLLLGLSLGCESPAPPADARIVSGKATPLTQPIQPDDQIATLISPYREQLRSSMDQQVGVAAAQLGKGRPESALGNLVADSLLWFARKEIGAGVDLSVINRGGIRLPAIPAGPISVADIYQLVPFDNHIVVLELTGSQLLKLLERLAEKGGEPMAGIRYQLSRSDHSVSDILIGSRDWTADETYRVVTVDYLASIGGEFEVLGQGQSRRDDEAFLRDAVIAYIRDRKELRPELDQRVTYE